jgi:hypothetical protein
MPMQHIMEMECSFRALFIFFGLLMPCLAPGIFDQTDIYLFDRLIKGKKNFAGSEKNFRIGWQAGFMVSRDRGSPILLR